MNDAVLRVLNSQQFFWLTAGLALAVWQVSGAIRLSMGALNRATEPTRTATCGASSPSPCCSRPSRSSWSAWRSPRSSSLPSSSTTCSGRASRSRSSPSWCAGPSPRPCCSSSSGCWSRTARTGPAAAPRHRWRGAGRRLLDRHLADLRPLPDQVRELRIAVRQPRHRLHRHRVRLALLDGVHDRGPDRRAGAREDRGGLSRPGLRAASRPRRRRDNQIRSRRPCSRSRESRTRCRPNGSARPASGSGHRSRATHRGA